MREICLSNSLVRTFKKCRCFHRDSFCWKEGLSVLNRTKQILMMKFVFCFFLPTRSHSPLGMQVETSTSIIWRSSSHPLWVHEPNFKSHFCTSNGNHRTSMQQVLLSMPVEEGWKTSPNFLLLAAKQVQGAGFLFLASGPQIKCTQQYQERNPAP